MPGPSLSRKEIKAQKLETERQEALKHLTYFKELALAYEQATKRMAENARICAKNLRLWQSRLDKMEGGEGACHYQQSPKI